MTVFVLSVTLEDDFGRTARKRYQTEDIVGVDVGAEYLTAQGFATTLLTALGNLSEMRILYYSLGRDVTYTDTVDADANNDQGLTAVARKLNNKLTVLKVPGPVMSVFQVDGTLDILDALVTAYTNHFIATAGFTTSDGETITALVRGRLDQ